MVVTPEEGATRAGIEALQAGGNAVDAAVAAAFALGVTQPQSTGIGGGAFVLLRLADGQTFAVDARETAPARATAEMFAAPEALPGEKVAGGVAPRTRSRLALGGLASGTPGMVAGLALIQERWGKRSLSDSLQPAIRLAAQGYPVGAYQMKWMKRLREPLTQRFPDTAEIQLAPKGAAPGWKLVQKDLAGTLRRIARHGPDAFYRGEIAQAIVKEVERTGGVLGLEDLAGYEAVVRKPIVGRYRGFEILGFPPPSSGGIALVQILNILEGFDLDALGAGSSASIHRTAEAMKLAFADRAVHLGDADFEYVPVQRLTSESYAASLRGRINPSWWRRAPWNWLQGEAAVAVDGPGFIPEDRGTAHLSVIDAEGNAVALTGSINGPYGSWVTVPGTGILMNNHMDDFVTDPDAPNFYGLVGIGKANWIEPRKRPLSSMSPTILVKDGEVALVAGSNGGPRIITAVLLTILNWVDWDMDVAEAVYAPRFHHQWRPDVLQVERAIPPDVVDALRSRGHEIKLVDELTQGVEAIAVDPKTGVRYGANDPRRQGLALGE
jgi:gamma-glutamyltranspeptidase/glutathione hydrolase